MKTNFYSISLCVFTLVIYGITFSACSKEDILLDQEKDRIIRTKTNNSFHWTCTECGYTLNGGWQNYCSVCSAEFSREHGNLVLSFITAIKNPVATSPVNDGNINKIQLPGLIYPIKEPTPWYDTPNCIKFYENLKTLYYYSNAEYAEGVDVGWYRTTRAIFPGNTSSIEIERLYDRFTITSGTSLKGSKGSGIKDASKAAVQAFAVY